MEDLIGRTTPDGYLVTALDATGEVCIIERYGSEQLALVSELVLLDAPAPIIVDTVYLAGEAWCVLGGEAA